MAETDPWADLADDIRRDADRRHHFEPAAGCRCASCIERRGYAEQAEVWQARATRAEARVAELEAAVSMLRVALDPLVSAGCRLPDEGDDDAIGYVRVTEGQARAAYRAYLATRSESHA